MKKALLPPLPRASLTCRLLVEEAERPWGSLCVSGEHCYVYAHLPATEGLEHCKALGFIAHMDTVSDFCDHAVTPVVTEDYDGKELPLAQAAELFPRKCSPILLHLPGVP